MQAPRLRVGIVGDTAEGRRLGEQLLDVGHTVTGLPDLMEAAGQELVIIAATEEDLPGLVEELSARARRGQVYLHTCLAHGVQVLDPLETSGAVVIAAAQLSPRRWVVTTADELGQTVAELLIGELGAGVVTVTDAQRLRLATAMTYVRAAAAVGEDARRMLATVIEDREEAGDIGRETDPTARLPDIGGPAGLMAQRASIDEPGRARTFLDLVRRAAEINQSHDIELWAIQEEKP